MCGCAGWPGLCLSRWMCGGKVLWLVLGLMLGLGIKRNMVRVRSSLSW